jgi:hypothetical protein
MPYPTGWGILLMWRRSHALACVCVECMREFHYQPEGAQTKGQDMTTVIVTGAAVHYGFPTVWVEEYAATDYRDRPCVVREFFQNGGMVTCKGTLVRKDGTMYDRFQELSGIPTPVVVLEALAAL